MVEEANQPRNIVQMKYEGIVKEIMEDAIIIELKIKPRTDLEFSTEEITGEIPAVGSRIVYTQTVEVLPRSTNPPELEPLKDYVRDVPSGPNGEYTFGR
jgi:hypothetical protein